MATRAFQRAENSHERAHEIIIYVSLLILEHRDGCGRDPEIIPGSFVLEGYRFLHERRSRRRSFNDGTIPTATAAGCWI